MKWLITVAADANLESVVEWLESVGGKLSRGSPPVSFEGGERVIAVDGPEDLPVSAARQPGIRSVHENADLSFY